MTPSDLQKNAKIETREQPAAYDPQVKLIALNMLYEYSVATGKKWGRICGEMTALVGAPSTNALTRQDLESWIRGDSVLGNAKFDIVYRFLTHEKTASIRAFENAREALRPNGHVVRHGRFLSKLFAGIDHVSGPASSKVREKLRSVDGLYSSDKTGDAVLRRLYLSLHTPIDECFSIAHIILDRDERSRSNQPLERWSGYAIATDPLSLHLARTDRDRLETYYLLIEGGRAKTLVNGPRLVANAKGDRGRGRRVGAFLPSTLPLDRCSDEEIYMLVENVMWNVPV